MEHTGHLAVSATGTTSTAPGLVESKISSVEGVTGVVATTYEPAALVIGDRRQYALLHTVPNNSARFSSAGIKPSGNVQVLLGKRMMPENVSVEMPGTASLIFEGRGKEPKLTAVDVVGTFETGLYEYDSTWVLIRERDYALLKGAQEFHPSAYAVFVEDPFSSSGVAARLKEALGSGFEVVDWREANKPLFAAMALERKVALFVIALIVLVSALNIATTLTLLVNERLPDIAVLRTCGASSKMLAAVFLVEGWILSAAGIAIGTVAGILTGIVVNGSGLISLPAEVYSLNRVDVVIAPSDVAMAGAATLVICTIAMALPVLKAAGTRPLENLRVK